jgi:hypothetical protein
MDAMAKPLPNRDDSRPKPELQLWVRSRERSRPQDRCVVGHLGAQRLILPPDGPAGAREQPRRRLAPALVNVIGNGIAPIAPILRHPTRFERVTIAFGGKMSTPPY